MFDLTPAEFYGYGLALFAAIFLIIRFFQTVPRLDDDPAEDEFGPVYTDFTDEAGA